jgi:polyribonucleotide nucleotidyltransferase
MFNVVKKTLSWGGAELALETGRIARQADGAVLATLGETAVLCTAVAMKKPKEGCDFLPLTVNYQEKTYSAGKIPGGFIKRETRPSEYEILTSRLIDRPIRPLFPEGFYNDCQVICTLISYDRVNQPDVLAVIGASAALALSGVPVEEAVAAARVGYKDGQYLLNPTREETDEGDLDLVVAGTESSVLMVESEANLLSEEIMLGAVKFGHEAFQPVIALINELKRDAGKAAWSFTPEDVSALVADVEQKFGGRIQDAYALADKQERRAALDSVQTEFGVYYAEKYGADADKNAAGRAFKKAESKVVRKSILEKGARIDGRTPTDIRPIVAETRLLGRTHGSALFTRGETQALVVVTLGTDSDAQIVDALHGEYREHFMLNYNFPPYCVGETGPLRAPGRREIGHGKLAWRALQAVVPNKEEFAYTVRAVSEITESNGSSSMATVCGTSLALMDAGVPVKAPVAGIAMGLIKEGAAFTVLSDILGDEDHLGDMDFKVAGTEQGVTALQMDIKVNGITIEIMEKALHQAREGRLHILGKMNEVMASPSADVSPNAPRITQIKIDPGKIGVIIGPGGKMIKEICEVSGASIDIADDGTVSISSVDSSQSDKAIQMIRSLVFEPVIGEVYEGTVTKILEFGAVVTFMGSASGLVHISELANERVGKVTDVVKEGQHVKVKIISVERGKTRLSIKRVNEGQANANGDKAEANDSDDAGGNEDAAPPAVSSAPAEEARPQQPKANAAVDKQRKRKFF